MPFSTSRRRRSMETLDVRPLLFLFLPMPVRVNDQQDKKDQSADQQHENDRLVLPNFADKAGKIWKHPALIYIGLSQSQTAGSILPVKSPQSRPENLVQPAAASFSSSSSSSKSPINPRMRTRTTTRKMAQTSISVRR
jgi:hypothetical protein